MSVDFPAEGIPMIPTSATSLSSRWTSNFVPKSPCSQKCGALRVELTKWALPYPPFPPIQRRTTSPGLARSWRSFPLSFSYISVQTGSFTILSGAFAPCMSCMPHRSPSSAATSLTYRKSESVLIFGSAITKRSPQRPPSPPKGPPFAMRASLRQETIPFPPFPARNFISTESMNILTFSIYILNLIKYKKKILSVY